MLKSGDFQVPLRSGPALKTWAWSSHMIVKAGRVSLLDLPVQDARIPSEKKDLK